MAVKKFLRNINLTYKLISPQNKNNPSLIMNNKNPIARRHSLRSKLQGIHPVKNV
jgi:hypothetical protein